MSQEEAFDLLKDCVREIQKRLVINMPNFQVSKYYIIFFFVTDGVGQNKLECSSLASFYDRLVSLCGSAVRLV
jgi:hypothetical protein